MKGIIINEGSPLLENKYVNACYIKNADLTVQLSAGGETSYNLSGEKTESANACCSKKDTYDFETGALIALMKMCGCRKVADACNEAFPKERYNTYIAKFEGELCELKKEYDKLGDRNKYLMEDINKKLGYLKEKDEEIEKLKSDKDKSWKNYQRNIQKKQDRINELEEENKKLKKAGKDIHDFNGRLIDEIDQKGLEIMSLKKDNESFRKTCEKLKEENERLENENSLLRNKNNELTEKKKDLKKKLNAVYGYIDTDNVKPELPKTLDINGVKYRECDEKGRVVWMTSVPEIKPLSSNCPSWLDGKKWGYISIDEFAFKPISKREKMWDYILKEGRTPVYVERKDIHDFLEECQIAGIKWLSGKMPLEAAPFDLSEDDGMYFFVMSSRAPNGFRHVMTWWVKTYDEDERKAINYLPPMRWDLFEKGRIFVGVRRDQYNDFRDEITRQFGLTNQHKPYEDFNYTFYMYDKKTNFIEALGRSQFREIKTINGHKVVYWEDVR